MATAHIRHTELKAAADAAWKEHTHDHQGRPRFDHAGSQSWLKSYNEGFLKFDAQHMAPLAKAHALWMQHPRMTHHMSCNFDCTDPDSGVAYTATFVNLLTNTLDKQPSYDLYVQWLNAGDYADKNLAMRALGFNQTELIEKLKAADASPVDGRAFPSDAAASAVATFMDNMPPTANAQLMALLAGLSGPSLTYWNNFNAGKIGGKAAAALAAVSGKQFVRLPINGNRGQFIQAYMRELYRLDPELRVKPNQLQAAIAKQLKLLEIEGVKMKGHSKLGWYVLLDKDALAGATSKNLSGQALADELVKAIRTPQDIQKLDVARTVRFRNVAYGGATALGGMLMALNFTKLLEDVDKSMNHELTEAKAKLAIGGVAIGGFVAEQLGNGLKKLGETRLKNAAGLSAVKWGERFARFGRFAGFGTGAILGVWDVLKGIGEYQKGSYGLATAYISSGIAATVVSSVLFFSAFGLLGWVALGIGVLVWLVATYFVETLKGNPRQEWLFRCHFGAAKEQEKYPDLKTHDEQLQRALAA
jgi:hypothetical protein